MIGDFSTNNVSNDFRIALLDFNCGLDGVFVIIGLDFCFIPGELDLGGITSSTGLSGSIIKDAVSCDVVNWLDLDEFIGLSFHKKLHALPQLCIIVAQAEEAVDGVNKNLHLVVLVAARVIAFELELHNSLVDCSLACCPCSVVGFAHCLWWEGQWFGLYYVSM